ncbi:MAG: ATP-binding protein [Oscillospiraceae bacterium]|nr:ATP-binding protein [Oscillospiraceae bacterium]
MALDGKLLARARENLENLHANNVAEHYLRQEKIYSRIPEIERIDTRLRTQMTELVGLTLRGGAELNTAIKTLEDESLALQAKKAELLVERGYEMDYLDDIFSCPACRDTGYVGGKMCSCLKAMYNAEVTRELGTLLKNSDECFEKFDLSLYGDARESMEIVYNTCREYANSFSDRSMNLMFQGGTGLGKTFLSACIARVVAGNGHSVCYDTASSALEAFETKKFSRDAQTAENAAVKVERMLDCELMILDDLGTEMPTPMSVSALYTLINTRLVNGRKTVISTNLTDAELSKRYNPQICSRLEGEFTKLPFFGSDIRLTKKEM